MQTDWDFCTTSLRQVSRTFSRPIEVLPGDLRKAVTCGYLLCRIVDAVEDNEAFTTTQRDDRYREFHGVLRGVAPATEFERLWTGVEGSPKHEIELCSQIHRVMAILDKLPTDMRDAVLRWVAEMARGMQIYSHRSADRDGVIAPWTTEDLQRYCYFVAGTVGHMLTDLFTSEMDLEPDSPVAQRMSELAEAFGAGLQLVNILKDITDDLHRGWSFVPRSLCSAQGLHNLDLTDPDHRAAAHRAVIPLFDLARRNLDRALEYALTVPAKHREVRLFCLLPLWLAVKTLRHAYGNDAMVTSGEEVKVSRREVEEVISRCTANFGNDAELRADYEAMWHPVSRPMAADERVVRGNGRGSTVKALTPPIERPSSRISGFYRLDIRNRHQELACRFDLSDDELELLRGAGVDGVGIADKMVENCVGVLSLPVGLGLNFQVNGKDYVVPMAVEEPSVVAAASNTARLIRASGGFHATATESLMIAQVQVFAVDEPSRARAAIEEAAHRILDAANQRHPNMVARGGGAKAVEVRTPGSDPQMLVVHLLVDCQDAMGANIVNDMAEGVAPLIEEVSGGRVRLRILSNLADRRLAQARCAIREDLLERQGHAGSAVAEGVVEAYQFAAVDPYRAATHNKGVMNGIDAVGIATGNDWRGLEAGAHAYAARNGAYEPLTRWWRADGHLHGEIELPMAVGTVGGSTRVQPTLRVLHKLLGAENAKELAMVMAAVGLAQNLGALSALATEGIQRGHMSLHARSVALSAGVPQDRIDDVAATLVRIGQFSPSAARKIADRE